MTQRRNRQLPIDFLDVAKQTGLRRGRICKTPFGWGVQNPGGSPSIALFNPPAMQEGESVLCIRDNQWCFYA
jgi:hypothetical protein